MTAPSQLRAGNVASVVEALRHHGSLSRTDLARLTGVSRTTALSILEELEVAGFVEVRERPNDDPPRRSLGRPAVTVALRPPAGVALGLFVGREDLHVAVADLSLTVLAQRTTRFGRRPPARALIEHALELAEEALGAAGLDRSTLVGAALGIPSPIDPHTGAVDARILPDWDPVAVRETLTERLGTPVVLENDANVAALAELTAGAGRGLRDVIFVHVGFGIGGAIVLDGRLRRGSTGTAGELAHIRVPGADGPPCLCSRRDCLRSVASGSALLHALAIAHGSELDLGDLAALVRDGDAGAARLLTDAGDAIGTVVAGLCRTLNPEAVIIGGPLVTAGGQLVDAARQRIEREGHPLIGPVRVLPAALGDLGGALGAASLVVRSSDLFGHRVPIDPF